MDLYAIGFFAAFGLILVIWFVFVAPSERRYHEKKLRLLQERIEKRERHLRDRESEESADRTIDSG